MTKFVGNNIGLPKLETAPPSPVSGDTYYNTTFNKPYTYNGTDWVDLTLTSSTSGATGYWGSFWSTQDQTAASANTEYLITYNNTDPDSTGVSVASNSRVTFAYTGVYSLTFSVQWVNTGAQIYDANVWLKKNGSNVADSDSKWSVVGSHGGVDGHAIGTVNYVLKVTAGDYLELAWQTTNTDVSIQADPAASPAPSIPSIILTAIQVMNTQQVELTNSTSTTSSTIAASATAVKSAYDLAGTKAAVGSTTPSTTNTTSSAGSSSEASRADHVHATATSSATPQAVAATAVVGTSGIPSRQDHVHAGVTSITGTANQVTASASAGAVTLSLPQSIATASSPTFAEVTTTGAIRTATGNADPAVYVGDDALIFDADTADSLGIQGQQTATNGAIVFGSGKDTNLYRGGANTLKTDDAFTATGNITSGGYLGANGRVYYDTNVSGIYIALSGTNTRLVQNINPTANVGVDFAASTSSSTSGIIITKSLTGQPTSNVGGSGTTDAFADTVRNGGMALDNGNQRFYVYSTGAWRYASLTNPSDSRLKEEITEISGAIDKLRQLIPVSFKWKAPHLHERSDAVADDGSRIGFIAEQVATTDLKHWVETMNISGEEAEIATGNAAETEILAVNIPQNEIEALLVQALLDIDTRLKAIEEKL